MKFSLLITGAPYSSPASVTALKFAQALIRNDHDIYRLFFFGDGVLHGNSLSVVPQDESNLVDKWQELIRNSEADAVVCVTSALKQGVLDAQEAQRHSKPASNLPDGFTIGGLGLLVDAIDSSDRLVSFG